MFDPELLSQTAAAPAPGHRSKAPLAHYLSDPGAVTHRVLDHLAHVAAGLGHALLPVAMLAGVLVAVLGVVAVLRRVAWRSGGRWIEIAPPALPDAGGGLACWKMLSPLLTSRHGLGGARPPVALEFVGDAGGLAVGLWVASTLSVKAVVAIVEAAWPGARASVTEPRHLGSGAVSGGEARCFLPEWFALGGSEASSDPIRAVLGALTDASASEETAIFQVLARPAPRRRIARTRRAVLAVRRGEPTSGSARALDALSGVVSTRTSSRHTTTDPLALFDVRAITEKVNAAPHFEVAIRYGVAGGTGRIGRRTRRAKLRQLDAALGLYAGRNHLVGRYLARPAAVLSSHRMRHGFLCSVLELAALAHLPHEPAAYGMAAAPARTVAPPRDVTDA